MIIQQERLKEHLTQGPFLRLPLATQAVYLHILANMNAEGVVDVEVARRLSGAAERDVDPLYDAEFIYDIDGCEASVLSAKFLQGGGADGK